MTLEMKPEMMVQIFPATLSRPVTEAAMLKGSAIETFGRENDFDGDRKKKGLEMTWARLGEALFPNTATASPIAPVRVEG